MEDLLILVYNDVDWLNHRIAPVEISLENLRTRQNMTEEDIDKLHVLDVGRKQVEYQIDRIDRDDTTKDVLIFMAEVKENPSIYYISASNYPERRISAFSKEKWDNGSWQFQFRNDRIELDFGRGTAYANLAGSARNVSLKNSENIASYPFGRENSKILMQLESLNVSRYKQDWYFPTRDYEYVTSGEGAIRTFLTLRQPFSIGFKKEFIVGPDKTYDKCNCNLYRVISLFRGKDYINEEIFIEAKNLENSSNKEIFGLDKIKLLFEFSPTFLAIVPGINEHMDAKMDYPGGDKKNRGWFGVGNSHGNRPGFGFAGNSPLKDDINMWESYIRWAVSPTYRLKCLHQFMDETNTTVDGKYDPGHVVGANWFNAIYKPLWAK